MKTIEIHSASTVRIPLESPIRQAATAKELVSFKVVNGHGVPASHHHTQLSTPDATD